MVRKNETARGPDAREGDDEAARLLHGAADGHAARDEAGGRDHDGLEVQQVRVLRLQLRAHLCGRAEQRAVRVRTYTYTPPRTVQGGAAAAGLSGGRNVVAAAAVGERLPG